MNKFPQCSVILGALLILALWLVHHCSKDTNSGKYLGKCVEMSQNAKQGRKMTHPTPTSITSAPVSS